MIDYNSVIPEKIREIKPSGIRKFFDMVSTMKGVISLTVGQPDFVTPWHIREAAIASLVDGKTYYTSNAGMQEIRNEISLYLSRRFSLEYTPRETFVTVGGSEAIDVAMRAVLAPGDEVILPQPAFVCYEPIAQLCGARVIKIPTKEENAFKLTAEELKKNITPKTKLLVLPYPNNPTGAIMEKAELEEIARVLRGTNIMVLSDEIYAELTYAAPHVSIASLDGMKERTILVSGFSKAYAMTGWRLGYVCAPEAVTKQMLKIHQYAIMCAPTVSQFAAAEALKNGDVDIEYMKSEYDCRRKFIVDGLNKIGLHCFEPKGAFYVFPRVKDTGLTSEAFAERLLSEYKVAVVPGTAFGDCGEGYVRISYAYSVEHIQTALIRMAEFLAGLKK
ncbi:MAG: aminotransferase class I/II-fold pyridoxal phosphate-dependent enzyme [Candidatus Borkfalkiaceae bacterium]|nr:aminotransferase class I/II-fold pyridoxal phosphate-dependent enzyme [Clostridia bacterium]MDY6222688.1 aminotransferase class I/II-fold pyridoxal phosphate-dependent enzyme [Christensenellaceae bacterium]